MILCCLVVPIAMFGVKDPNGLYLPSIIICGGQAEVIHYDNARI